MKIKKTYHVFNLYMIDFFPGGGGAATVRKNGGQPTEFAEKLQSLCSQYRKEKKALLFAFPIFDISDANIIKVLQDREYWDSLDAVSGKYISVFSTHSPHQKDADAQKQLMKSFHKFIDDYFDSSESSTSPCLLFFQVGKNEVIDSHRVKLTSAKVEDSYLEMKNVLEVAANAVSDVTPENWDNLEEIFSLMKNEMMNYQSGITIQSGFKKIVSLKRLVSSLTVS